MHVSAVAPKTRIDNKRRKTAYETSEQVKGMMLSGQFVRVMAGITSSKSFLSFFSPTKCGGKNCGC